MATTFVSKAIMLPYSQNSPHQRYIAQISFPSEAPSGVWGLYRRNLIRERSPFSGLGFFRLIFTPMLTYNQAFYQLKDQLQPLYDEQEATAIAHLFLEFVTGLNKLDRLTKKDTAFTKRQQGLFDDKTTDLLKGKPIQYVTNSAWFMGREFVVNENVLIPRPETEELVQWVIDEQKDKEKLRILDVGCGSGCIGISLGRLLSYGVVTCVDISKEALDVVETNIQWVLDNKEKSRHAENIRLVALDFLDEAIRNKELGRYDIVVSNPPYIPYKEKDKLHDNVSKYEPTIALFLPNNDPLVFYKALAAFGMEHLKQEGTIYCELDAAHAEKCKALFIAAGYEQVELKKDMHDNWRMLRCRKPAPEAIAEPSLDA
jgi:release factor glutamine methyltransferase